MFLYGAIVIFCCVLYGASAVLCKYALQRELPQHASWKQKARAAIRNKFWLAGWLAGASANLIIIEIQSLADITLVYPLLNFAYVFTLILGYLFLQEILSREQWIGVITAILGTTILLFVSDPSTGHESYLLPLGVVTGLSLIAIIALVAAALRDERPIHEIYFATCAGIAFGNVEMFLKVNTNLIASQLGHFSITSWESLSAFITLWPVLFIVVFSLIGFIFMQIALAHGDVSVSVPLVIITQRPVTLVAGYGVFGEEFPAIKIIGIGAMLLSILVITVATIRKGAAAKPAEAVN